MKLYDYECVTTFWDDFSIAEKFGNDAIEDTYDRVFEEWKSNFIYLTELVMVLNHKLWYWYERSDLTTARSDRAREYTQTYNVLYEETSKYAEENLKGEQLSYYYRITD